MPKKSRNQRINASVKFNEWWPDFTQMRLTVNMRANRDEIEFSYWLKALGNGTLSNSFSKFPNAVTS